MGKLRCGAGPLNGSLVLALAAGSLAVPLACGTPASARASASSSQSAEIAAFYRGRDGAPLWLSSKAGAAAPQLISLLETAQADHLNPRRYNVKGLSRAVDAARGGDAAAVQRTDAMLSAAFIAYARDQRHDPGGVIYVDQQLKPATGFGSRAAECCSARALALRLCPEHGLDEPDLRKASGSDREPALPNRQRAAPARAQSRAGAGAPEAKAVT